MSVKFSVHFKKTPRLNVQENGLLLRGEQGNPTVILIHGLTGTPNEMKFLAHFLNRKGYSVICPRLANHGEPIEILKWTRWEEFYGSVRKAFLDLNLENNQSSVFVAGLSMGALLALLLAEEFPNAIAGVTCLSPTLFYDGWNVPWTRHLLRLVSWNPLKHFFYFKEEPPYGIKNEAIRQKVHEYYRNAELHELNGAAKYGYAYFPVTLLCDLNRLVRHLNKKLSRIHTPVQIIQAKDDDMTSIKNSEFIYDRISSKIKQVFLLHNSYHVITADHERETVSEEMSRFFGLIRKNMPLEKTVSTLEN